jgi:hypothetical protein
MSRKGVSLNAVRIVIVEHRCEPSARLVNGLYGLRTATRKPNDKYGALREW